MNKKIIQFSILSAFFMSYVSASNRPHETSVTVVIGDKESINETKKKMLQRRPNAVTLYCTKKNLTDEWLDGIQALMKTIHPLTIMVECLPSEEMQQWRTEAFSWYIAYLLKK